MAEYNNKGHPDRNFELIGSSDSGGAVAVNGNAHGSSARRDVEDLVAQRAHPAVIDGDVTSRAQRKSLGDWLDIDAETLASLSPRSLSALAGGIEDGRAATATVGTLRKELDSLQKTADTDFLTGISNRRAIEARLEAEWRRAQRHGRPLAILMVDIDGLKVINDSRGHPVGDFVISEVARRLAGAIRIEDTVARIGGDEYMVVCPETDDVSARAIARKLSRTVGGRLMKAPGDSLAVRVSIGSASTSKSQSSPKALVAAADARLYDVKRTRHAHGEKLP